MFILPAAKKLANELHVLWYHARMLEMCYVSAISRFLLWMGELVFFEKKRENKIKVFSKQENYQLSCVCVFFTWEFCTGKHSNHTCCTKKKKKIDDFPTFYYNDESLPDIILWHENEDRMASKL